MKRRPTTSHTPALGNIEQNAERTSDRCCAAVAEAPSSAAQRVELGDCELSVPPSRGESESQPQENLFHVLGHRARTRTLSELWLIALCGLLNTVLLSWRYPALSWLASACAATGAYGLWGLLDRAAHTKMSTEEMSRRPIQALIGLRDLTAIAGTVAALWTVLALTTTALGNWVH
jgi:hypothetical protein